MDYRMHLIHYHLVQNRHLPFEALRVLTDDKWLWAKNYTTPPDVLDELASDKWAVRFWVARHPNTSEHTLMRLRQDRDPEIRYRATVKPRTPHGYFDW